MQFRQRITRARITFALTTVALATTPLAAQPGVRGFYQHPTLHGETIVFAAEGDLWQVPATGGLARRLTSHPAEESHPVVSPDGTTLAFTARYEGQTEVYTMPLSGGLPTRRTWEGEASLATAFTPNGELVYTTTKYSGIPKPQMVRVNLSDHVRTLIPLAGASEGHYDASGRALYFVRPGFHNNVTKRYTGGTARSVWVFRDGATEAQRVTPEWRGESHTPLWFNARVYFVTDRDGTMNIWSVTESGGDLQQHTRHSGWDVIRPSMHNGRIVYQNGADLWLLDTRSNNTQRVDITIASDLDQLRQRWVSEPLQYLSSAHLSPTGDRVVLTSRGRVFVAPAGPGRLVRASLKDSVRYRDAVFMPDGKSLLALSDERGELEFARVPANGVGTDSLLTRDGTVLRFEGTPSPDGAWIAWADNNNDFHLRNLRTNEVRKLNLNTEGIGDRSWSPDSRYLVWEHVERNTFTRLMLYDVAANRSTPLTSDRVNSFSAAWDPKGDFLYFLSDRNLRTSVGSPWGARQPDPYFDKQIEIYQLALRTGVRSPFRAPDELHAATDTAARPANNTTAPAARPAARADVRIDTANIMRRIDRVPVPAGNYSQLVTNADALFYLARGETRTDVHALRRAHKAEAVPIVEGARSLELSRDGKKLLVRRADALHVIDARAVKPGNIADSRVDLTGWRFAIDVRDDWRQLFTDAWRLERDYFYDPGFHGIDWAATLAKHQPLVERITTRQELSVLIGWMVGELSALHTSVGGGDLRRAPDIVNTASLGAHLVREPARGGYRIARIYEADPDYPDQRAPLADPYLEIAAGDVITAVNGTRTLDAPDIGELLRDQTGKQVLLTIARGSSTRDVVTTPIGNESNLRYTDWELSRRRAVEAASNNTIGYVHLRAMGADDVNQWYREFYPAFNRQGLIIDVRQNRGGNIDSFILDKLMRKAWMYWKGRAGEPTWNMQYAFRGHMVVLVDAETASDGEAFADGFRRLGMGVVIGTRTWGGEIWLSGVNTLTDGGVARAPMTGVYGPEGKWLIEQIGVIPDIEVDNLPHATFNGKDAQLEAAIAHLKQKIAEDPRDVPKPPAYPRVAFPYPPR
jgi:tricorn protease